MGVPPSEGGGTHVRVTEDPVSLARSSIGSPGRPRGTTVATGLRGPSPAEFLAERAKS